MILWELHASFISIGKKQRTKMRARLAPHVHQSFYPRARTTQVTSKSINHATHTHYSAINLYIERDASCTLCHIFTSHPKVMLGTTSSLDNFEGTKLPTQNLVQNRQAKHRYAHTRTNQQRGQNHHRKKVKEKKKRTPPRAEIRER